MQARPGRELLYQVANSSTFPFYTIPGVALSFVVHDGLETASQHIQKARQWRKRQEGKGHRTHANFTLRKFSGSCRTVSGQSRASWLHTALKGLRDVVLTLEATFLLRDEDN